MQPTANEHAALVALLRVSGLSWPKAAAKLVELGSASAMWADLDDGALVPDPERDQALEAAARDVEAWQQHDWRVLSILDADYPTRLREIHQAPPLLFAAGRTIPDDVGIAVVGSRKASSQGLKMATAIAGALVDLQITVVSGLAHGIDGAAHRQALAAGGRTVAFLGTGITQTYPPEHADLQQRISRDGLVLSQFWPDAPPRPEQFIMRNASMSGYSRATVVVEAGERSGARAQARMAVEHGRPVILTDRVVEANDWATRLTDRPGVTVASSLDDVMRQVEVAVAQEETIDTLLSELAHTGL
jgi:DNA processing protein